MDARIRTELAALHLKLGIQKKKEPVEKKKPKKPELVEPDFYQPLIEAGILKKIQPAKFNEFLGAFSYLRAEQESQAPGQIDPSLAQLKNTIIEQMAWTLSTGLNIENKLKSFLFYGPRGTGKSLMLRALASEVGATIFDISTQVIGDCYLDKQSA